jgi:hypothetical protein
MSKLVGFGLVATIIAVVAITGIVLNFYYRPTLEHANRSGAGPAEPVHGWRRVAALIVITPVAAVVLPFFAITEWWRRRSDQQ